MHFFVWAHAPCLCTSTIYSVHKNILNNSCTRYSAVFRAFLPNNYCASGVTALTFSLKLVCVQSRGLGGSGFAYIVDETEITYTVGESQYFPWEYTAYEYKNNISQRKVPSMIEKQCEGDIQRYSQWGNKAHNVFVLLFQKYKMFSFRVVYDLGWG